MYSVPSPIPVAPAFPASPRYARQALDQQRAAAGEHCTSQVIAASPAFTSGIRIDRLTRLLDCCLGTSIVEHATIMAPNRPFATGR
jgi:hypothetical protein